MPSAARTAPSAPVPPPQSGWTPDLVAEALIEAMVWVRRFGGPAGPRAWGTINLNFRASLDDHLAEGWGLPELAEDDLSENEKDDRLILPPSAADVSRHLAALEWPADYLCPDHIGSARMLGLWAVCRARRISFGRSLKGRVARGHAYHLRDRGLSLISQALARDGIPVAVK